jgi:phosphonate transport system substrate-binding protein
MPVELIETGTYSTQIEAFRAGKVDVGSLSPFSYVIASERTKNVEPLVARGYATGEKSSYRSVLIVPPDSPIHTIDDLKANASKMTMAWVDPASASGHLLPRAYLESIGMNPEKDFKNVIFTLQHLATAMSIKAGKVDVAASMNTGLQRMIEKGRITENDYRIIWQSEPIINDITAVRSDLPHELKEEIRQAYLDFPKQEPEVWSKFKALFPEPSLVWVPAKDSDFDELRRIARSVKHMQLLEAP